MNDSHSDAARWPRRTVLTTGLAGAAATVLPGCSPGSASRGTTGGQELSVLLLGPSDQTVRFFTEKVIPRFADDTGITVSLQQSDWGSGFQKVLTAAASGTLTDLLMLGGIWTAPLAAKQALLPLDELLGDYGDLDAFYPAMLEDCRYDGKTYGLPLYSDTRTALYRKSHLEQAGLDPDRLPKSWDDYAEAARRLGSDGPADFPVDWSQDKSVGLQQTFAQLFLQAGGSYYDDAGRATFASDAGVRALEFMISFYADKLASPDLVNTGSGASPFTRGRSSMIFSGLSAIKNAQDNQAEAVDDIVVGTPLSADPSGRPVTSAWINKIGISAKTKNRDGAWQLLQFLVSADIAVTFDEQYGGLPARTDLAEAGYLKDLSPNLVRAAESIVPQPPHPNMLTIAPQITTHLQQAIRLSGTPKEILTALDAKLNEINGV